MDQYLIIKNGDRIPLHQDPEFVYLIQLKNDEKSLLFSNLQYNLIPVDRFKMKIPAVCIALL